ncbi:hypothetical protein ACFL9U_02305 [Thermodesulfobacteriota bacterium]
MDLQVEDLLPHRGRLKLIDEILELDEEKAVTQSTVTDQWPLFDGNVVNSLVLIELVAQTAGISNTWDGVKRHGDSFKTKGWLVGIKQSRFYVDAIPLGSCIITRTENQFKYESYRDILGIVEIDTETVGEVRLQLFQPEED